MMDPALKEKLLRAQENEITEYTIYKKLASRAKNATGREVFEKLAAEELAHYQFLQTFHSERVEPSRFRVSLFYWIARFFGINFGVRLMEKGEGSAQSAYGALRTVDPKIEDLIREEEHHEEALLELIDQKALQYTGSIVLGLNDALVELMGVLAGLTLALRDTTLVAVAGFITGVAASLSMAGSEYLSTKEEGTRSPLKASLYTGAAYVFAVVFLIFPYFLFDNPLVCLSVAVTSALMIILVFTFYIAVAKGLSFRRRFFEMAAISLGVAILNFCIGVLVRRYLHIEV